MSAKPIICCPLILKVLLKFKELLGTVIVLGWLFSQFCTSLAVKPPAEGVKAPSATPSSVTAPAAMTGLLVLPIAAILSELITAGFGFVEPLTKLELGVCSSAFAP